MKARRLLAALALAWFLPGPARAAVVKVPAQGVPLSPPSGLAPIPTGKELHRRLRESMSGQPSFMAFELSLRLAYPGDDPGTAMEKMREGTLLEVGAGRNLRLSRALVRDMGFDPKKVYALDPAIPSAQDPDFASGHLAPVKIEEAPENWSGLFDTAMTIFTFNPEIVHGWVPGMGEGISLPRATASLRRLLKPGGSLIVVAPGVEPGDMIHSVLSAELAERPRRLRGGIFVFDKPVP